MNYISKSALSLSGSHAAIDSNKKLLSASILQLQSTVLFNNTYGRLGISIRILLCAEQAILLKLGQLAKTISYPPSKYGWFHVCFIIVVIKYTIIFYCLSVQLKIQSTGTTIL